MDDKFNEIFEIAKEKNFSYTITCYNIVENENGEAGMRVSYIALFRDVPLFVDFIDLFRDFVTDSNHNIPEEYLATMYVRIDTMESLKLLLENNKMSNLDVKIKNYIIENNNEKDDNDGWEYGIAGNA